MRHILRVLAALAAVQIPCALAAQVLESQHPLPANIEVTDARLRTVMQRLLEGSPTARGVVADLVASGLIVTIGVPSDVPAATTDLRTDGFGPVTDRATALAWVMVQVAPSEQGDEVAERAWIVIDVDAMAERIARRSPARAESMLQSDLLATLAHEFVAHVGSIARTRSLADFCDDPRPASRSIDPLGCSVRVENRVRRELNRRLGLRGADRLAERQSYSLDAMNFAGQAD